MCYKEKEMGWWGQKDAIGKFQMVWSGRGHFPSPRSWCVTWYLDEEKEPDTWTSGQESPVKSAMSLRQEQTWPEKATGAQPLWSPAVDTKEERVFKVRQRGGQIPDPRAFRSVKRLMFYRSRWSELHFHSISLGTVFSRSLVMKEKGHIQIKGSMWPKGLPGAEKCHP